MEKASLASPCWAHCDHTTVTYLKFLLYFDIVYANKWKLSTHISCGHNSLSCLHLQIIPYNTKGYWHSHRVFLTSSRVWKDVYFPYPFLHSSLYKRLKTALTLRPNNVFQSIYISFTNLNYEAQKFTMVSFSLDIHGTNGLRTTLVFLWHRNWWLYSSHRASDYKSEIWWFESQLGNTHSVSHLQCCFQANSTCWN